MIHVYWGFGKGKTCSAVGQVMRMVGHNKKALFCQFIKDGSSGEVSIIKNENITYICPDNFQDVKSNTTVFSKVRVLYYKNNYDIIVLDEILDAIVGQAISEKELVNFIEYCNIYGTELVITGHYLPEPAILQRADYLTHFEKQKHPYDQGIKARKGVEY